MEISNFCKCLENSPTASVELCKPAIACACRTFKFLASSDFAFNLRSSSEIFMSCAAFCGKKLRHNIVGRGCCI